MGLAINHMCCSALYPTIAPSMCKTFDPAKEPPVPDAQRRRFARWYASEAMAGDCGQAPSGVLPGTGAQRIVSGVTISVR
jgi:hypothetical protein